MGAFRSLRCWCMADGQQLHVQCTSPLFGINATSPTTTRTVCIFIHLFVYSVVQRKKPALLLNPCHTRAIVSFSPCFLRADRVYETASSLNRFYFVVLEPAEPAEHSRVPFCLSSLTGRLQKRGVCLRAAIVGALVRSALALSFLAICVYS